MLFLLATSLLGFAKWRLLARHTLGAQTPSVELPADGRQHLATVLSEHWLPLHANRLRVMGATASRVRVEGLPGGLAALFFRAPVVPGAVRIDVADGASEVSIPVKLTPSFADSFGDGTPDWMRLHEATDRQAFRSWFTALAELAADRPSDRLPAELVDCASLLRYAYRESLRLHDDRWYAQFPAGEVPPLHSVQQWSYPHTPVGAALFRTRRGTFVPSDLVDGSFSQFANARTLLTMNTFPLGRDLKQARPGDLIFYRQLGENSLYHSMIITGEQGEWVVYHTGPIRHRRGEMRRVLLRDLLRHPDARWRPVASNPNFLGVYRWNILREE